MTGERDGAGPVAVLWDMDGTLVDSEKLWDVSLAGLARRLGGELSEATRAEMVGGSLGTTVRMTFAEVGREPGPGELDEAGHWLTERTGELFATDLRFRPGAPEALWRVRESGLATALVTSTERRLTEKALDTIGREFFDVVVCGDEVAASKPAPDPYLTAAAALGVDPARCVAVEDSPTGTAAAVAAGCVVLVVPNDVEVPTGPGRVHRDGLIGLTAAELARVWSGARTGDHWSPQNAHSAGPRPHGG